MLATETDSVTDNKENCDKKSKINVQVFHSCVFISVFLYVVKIVNYNYDTSGIRIIVLCWDWDSLYYKL